MEFFDFIKPDELDDLPEDPQAAFIAFVRIAGPRLKDRQKALGSEIATTTKISTMRDMASKTWFLEQREHMVSNRSQVLKCLRSKDMKTKTTASLGTIRHIT